MAPLLDRMFARRSWIVGGLLLLALTACRVPKLPVVEDKSEFGRRTRELRTEEGYADLLHN